MSAPDRFRDKVAVVTGAASGIGLATARRLGAEGARVVLADLDGGKADQAARQLMAEGVTEAMPAACDVSREADVAQTVERALQRFGRFDVLVNNAGVMIFKPLEQHTEADLLKVLQVDLLGAFFFTKQAFLHMAPGGSIVNVSSVHAVETTPLVAAYAAAKAALLSLTRSAAIEGKPKGIRVNAVLPGAVETPMLRENPNIRSGVEQLDPAAVGRPEDIAAVIAYLASSDACFVQGASVRADGGRLARL
jgi:NAD(P)-dependent dehydrogenase (short-subunit alcohol dehydrogenase family)